MPKIEFRNGRLTYEDVSETNHTAATIGSAITTFVDVIENILPHTTDNNE